MADRDPIEHLLSRIDRSVIPSADFARRLRDRLLAELDPNRDSEGDRPMMTAIPSVPNLGHPAVAPVQRRRPTGRWMPRLEAAAAILLLFGLFAALGGPDRLADRVAGLFPARDQATSKPLGPAAMLGGDAGRTGRQPGPAPRYEFVDAWTLGVDGTSRTGLSPVGLGDTCYRVFDASPASQPNGRSTRYLQAVDVVTGAVRWQQALMVWGSPAVTSDYVFVNVMPDRGGTPESTAASNAAVRARLVALDAKTGAIVWSIDTGPTEGWMAGVSPIVLDNLVYAVVPDGTVYAVDGRTGAPRWTSTEATFPVSGAESPSGPPPISGSGQFAAGDGALFVVNTGGQLVALDLSTGKRRWTIDIRARFGVLPESVEPIVVGRALVLKLRGFQQTTGQSGMGAPADIVAVVETATGHDRWHRTLTGFGNGLAVAANRVIVPMTGAGTGSVVAIDLQTGRDNWTLQGTDPNPGGASVVGSTVFLAGGDGELRAVDAGSGQELWHFATGTKLAFPPVVTQEHVIVQGEDGVLLSYSTNPAATPPAGP